MTKIKLWKEKRRLIIKLLPNILAKNLQAKRKWDDVIEMREEQKNKQKSLETENTFLGQNVLEYKGVDKEEFTNKS